MKDSLKFFNPKSLKIWQKKEKLQDFLIPKIFVRFFGVIYPSYRTPKSVLKNYALAEFFTYTSRCFMRKW